jgi:hypothetical protein
MYSTAQKLEGKILISGDNIFLQKRNINYHHDHGSFFKLLSAIGELCFSVEGCPISGLPIAIKRQVYV